MTLLRDLIDIPTSVGDGDFVVRAAEGADLRRYVVTEQLRDNFAEALRRIGHAVTTGRSQAMFLHGSFGSGKSHFMAVLREILRHNPEAREVRGLAEPVLAADGWLKDRRLLTLTFHMLDARSVEQAILEGYLNQITALHPEAPVPAVHRSDALLEDAARLRERLGEDDFFAALRNAGGPTAAGGGLAALRAQQAGWTAQTYTDAAAAAPGTKQRDALVSALTTAFFSGAVRSGEYLDLDTGLAVITRHAKDRGYDGLVLFLDELILWLSTRISDYTFVNTEGAKLNKLVESADAARPLPLISFVARQRNLEEFLGPQVGGTEREALAHVMRSVQGRLGEIVLADTNLPEITEGRLLKPVDDAARSVIDQAFVAVKGNREVWDTLLLGAQYGDAGIGSDADAFRRLYPFSPALVATLVALSQALQRERTALKVMTELLVERRDTLRVNDLIGVSALFEPLVLRGELPDRPKLKQLFQSARTLYTVKLRPLLLASNGITEEQAATHGQFQLDDKLIKTVLLGALVPDVPALHNLTAGKLHALNFGSITSPIPGYENQAVLGRLNKIANDAGELQISKDPVPVVTLKLHQVDFDKLLDLVPVKEIQTQEQLLRRIISDEMGITGSDGQLGELIYKRVWRGRQHTLQVRFGRIRDQDNMPNAALISANEGWRIVVDYPFDGSGAGRAAARSRIETLPGESRTVFWLPLHLTDEMLGRVGQLARIDYLVGRAGEVDRISSVAGDWSVADRQQGRSYLQQRQTQLRGAIIGAINQAYGAITAPRPDVQADSGEILRTHADGLRLGEPRGGTLKNALHHLTGELLVWSYPGRPALPDDEKVVTRQELNKIYEYAQRAAADPARTTNVPPNDQALVRRICNNLGLGELIEHRYLLNTSTSYWSRYFLQAASNEGYKERYPVHLLRRLIDTPAAFGFEPELQNLIIAVFGLEQQLAWFQGGGQVRVHNLGGVRDEYELRHPPMPSEPAWSTAVRRGAVLFGVVLPSWRTPANLGELASSLRTAAQRRSVAAGDLARHLTEHADVLGLDPAATGGRLATVRRAARLMADTAGEADDVVLVEEFARADLGDVDDEAVAQLLTSAPDLVVALTQANLWELLGAVAGQAGTDERAGAIIGELRVAARHQQHGHDLAAALRTAVTAATSLLASQVTATRPAAPEPRASPSAPDQPAGDPTPDGDGQLRPAADLMPVEMAGPPVPTQGTAGQPRRETVDADNWPRIAEEIAGAVAAGRRVHLVWEVR